MRGVVMSTLAQVALVLAVWTALVQGYRFAGQLVVLAKRVGSNVPNKTAWGWTSVAFWIVWVVLR